MGKNIKWENFDILATGQSVKHCKIKEILLTRDLKPVFNENVGSDKTFSLLAFYLFFPQTHLFVKNY